ncbi:uncharacterized protein LOC144942061 [Lampetra fluviatilis]
MDRRSKKSSGDASRRTDKTSPVECNDSATAEVNGIATAEDQVKPKSDVVQGKRTAYTAGLVLVRRPPAMKCIAVRPGLAPPASDSSGSESDSSSDSDEELGCTGWMLPTSVTNAPSTG